MQVERFVASAAELHALVVPDGLQQAQLWLLEPTRPALVLGSSQREDVVDHDAAAAAGVDVVRRSSGGGAVFLAPGRCAWIDVVVPPGDPHWSPDVRQSTYWIGEAWACALAGHGLRAVVHRGGLEQTTWGRLVCFGAVGPGEVVIEGRKVTGISQRRTRRGARFQCLVLQRWHPHDVVDLLDLTPDVRDRAAHELDDVATGTEIDLADLIGAFAEAADRQRW